MLPAKTAACAVALATIACGAAPTHPDLTPVTAITRILCFGDSLTEGEATPSSFTPLSALPTADPGTAKGYPYKLLSLLSARYTSQTVLVFNGGFGGRSLADDATGQPPRDLPMFIDALHPEVLILMHGANDLNAQNPNISAIANFAGALIDQAQSRGVLVILSSLPPRLAGGTPDRGGNPQLVVPFNAALAAVAAQKGARFVDVYGAIVQNLAGPDMAPDGLHLTQAGNQKLAQIYFDKLKALYER